MERRTFWKALAGIPVFLSLGRYAIAASAESIRPQEAVANVDGRMRAKWYRS